MTDTEAVDYGTDDPFTVHLVAKWMANKDQVEAIDEKMNVESFGKTKLLNTRYAEANPGLEDLRKSKATSPFAEQLRTILGAEGISDEEFVGRYETFRRTLSEFEARLNKYVEENVPKQDESDKPKDEELVAFRDERKKLVDSMNGIRTLLEGNDPTWFTAVGKALLVNDKGEQDKWENKRGAVGSREGTGTRLPAYQYTVIHGDNETVLQDKKLGAVQVYLKKFVKNVGEVWKAIDAANPNFDRKNPPERFEFTIGDRKIIAHKVMDESSEEDDSSDDSNNTGDIDELTLDVEDDSPEDFEDDSPTELFDDDPE